MWLDTTVSMSFTKYTLWSSAGKGLTSWLSFVMSNYEFVTFPLISYLIVSIPDLCNPIYVHHHFTRGSTENFIVPSVNGVAATTFYYSGIKDWNSLPSDVKQKCTFNGFKSAARQYLRSQLQLMDSDTYAYY